MRRRRLGLLVAAVFAATGTFALGAEVVVLKGGGVIALKEPWVRRGNTAYLTRADGILLSVPVSEIDREATAAAAAAAKAPRQAVGEQAAPATPADAVRGNREGPKARVKITDSDVSHPMDLSTTPTAEDKKAALAAGTARVELVTYNQVKEGNALVVTGQLRNPTQSVAEDVKLTVTVIDEKGQPIDSATASLSGVIESGDTASFTAKINIGDRIPASLRFAPTWTGPKPAPAPTPPGGRRSANGQRAPAPAPRPYGQGT